MVAYWKGDSATVSHAVDTAYTPSTDHQQMYQGSGAIYLHMFLQHRLQ